MKFLIEVLSDHPPAKKLPLNGPADSKTFLELSKDGKSITPGGVNLPGLEEIPDLSLLRITRQE